MGVNGSTRGTMTQIRDWAGRATVRAQQAQCKAFLSITLFL